MEFSGRASSDYRGSRHRRHDHRPLERRSRAASPRWSAAWRSSGMLLEW